MTQYHISARRRRGAETAVLNTSTRPSAAGLCSWIDRVEAACLDHVYRALLRTLGLVAGLVALWCVGVLVG